MVGASRTVFARTTVAPAAASLRIWEPGHAASRACPAVMTPLSTRTARRTSLRRPPIWRCTAFAVSSGSSVNTNASRFDKREAVAARSASHLNPLAPCSSRYLRDSEIIVKKPLSDW